MFNFMRLPPLRRLMLMKAITGGGSWSTISGNPVSFTAKAAPLRQLSVAFSPVQEGTGDPSPDNVRPILGWDSLNVEQRGKNLLTWAETYDKAYYSGEWHGTGDKVTDFTPSTAKWVSVRVLVKGLSAVTVSGMPSVGGVNGVFEFADGTVDYAGRWGSNQHNGTHNVPNGAVYMWMGVQISSTDIRTAYPNAMAESGTTASEYVPYNPLSRSISISLGQTVYSGTVDVVTGVGEIDRKSYQFDGTENWIYESAYSAFQIYGLITDARSMNSNVPNAICSSYIEARKMAASTANATFVLNSNSHTANRLYIKNLAYDASTKSEFAASLIGQTIVYELAEPFTIQLTPQEVESLAGDNTMWSDGDSLTVEYRSN